MWELSWYRYEIDLSDEGSGVRREGHGAELSDLAPEEQVVNAAADERGGAPPRRRAGRSRRMTESQRARNGYCRDRDLLRRTRAARA